MAIEVRGWRMVAPGRMESFTRGVDAPGAGNVLVEVAGCGVCHTDLGYLYDGVPTKHGVPLALGHEASGVVVAARPEDEHWIGRRVLVPAVWPCGGCRACRRGRPTACSESLMPGNDVDGAFASHLEAPARLLCDVDEAIDAEPRRAAGEPPVTPIGAAGLALWELAVAADAVTTPLEAIRRAGLARGELAVVVGAGGVGIFAVQIARARGATVCAIDVDEGRLTLAASLGAALTLDARRPLKEIRSALRDLCRARDLPVEGYRVFEMSGSRPGQELAWSLVSRGGSISVVGYTPEAATLPLSRLMALDATAYGNWGADPAVYPEAVRLLASGEVEVRRLVQRERLADAPAVLDRVHRREIRTRVVLTP